VPIIVDGDADPRDAVRAALHGGPPKRGEMHVVIALGRRWCQLRHLRGLPPIANAALARAAVAENASRFFLRSSKAFVTTGIAWTGEGEGWCAGFDAELIDALASICAEHGGRLRAVVPVDGFPGADAATIAAIDPSHPLALPISQREWVGRHWRDLVLAGSLVVSAVFCWIAPALAASSAKAIPLVATDASGVPATLVLARIVGALPPAARLSSVRVDSAVGEMLFVAERADSVLHAMAALPGLIGAEIAGTIATDDSRGSRRERVRVRFRIVDDAVVWRGAGASSGGIPPPLFAAPSRALAEARIAETLRSASTRSGANLGGVDLMRTPMHSGTSGQRLRARSMVVGSFESLIGFLAAIESGDPRLVVRQVAVRARASGSANVEADVVVEAIVAVTGTG
jgi:hypothetical protein